VGLPVLVYPEYLVGLPVLVYPEYLVGLPVLVYPEYLVGLRSWHRSTAGPPFFGLRWARSLLGVDQNR
jgi:hypothetical protein